MATFPLTERNQVRRLKARGNYDRDVVHSILDEAIVCHVGFVADGQPYVIPTIHVRVGEMLYLHGAPANHMLKSLNAGGQICVTVTLLDGLVLARSAFHHSMNYRSVCLFGEAIEVVDREEKLTALAALVQHVVPGREADARPTNEAELRAVQLSRLPITEASAKLRSGPPIDDPEDMDLPIWAGVIPLHQVAGPPVPAPDLAGYPATPPYVTDYGRS
jgi:nitroimidazol reductase NimA-like FMN-containing flavoprotein (pyridoxamine 5'-phosphate oxidase superfamily)